MVELTESQKRVAEYEFGYAGTRYVPGDVALRTTPGVEVVYPHTLRYPTHYATTGTGGVEVVSAPTQVTTLPMPTGAEADKFIQSGRDVIDKPFKATYPGRVSYVERATQFLEVPTTQAQLYTPYSTVREQPWRKTIGVSEAVEVASMLAEREDVTEMPAFGALYKRSTTGGVEYMVEPSDIVRERIGERVVERVERETPAERVLTQAATFVSPFGLEYAAAFLPGGKKPKEVRIKAEVAAKTEMDADEWLWGTFTGSVPGVIVTSAAFGLGAGTIVGAATKVPALASRAQFFKGLGLMGTAVYGVQKAFHLEKPVRKGDWEKVTEIGLRTALELPSAYVGFKAGYEAIVPKPTVETAFLSEAEIAGKRGRQRTFFKTKVDKDITAGIGETVFVKEGDISYGVTLGYADIEGGLADPFVMLTTGAELPPSAISQQLGVLPFAEQVRVIRPKGGILGDIFGGYDVTDVAVEGVSKPILGDFSTLVGETTAETGVTGIFHGVSKVTVGAPIEALPGSSYGIVAPPPTLTITPSIAGIGIPSVISPSLGVATPSLLLAVSDAQKEKDIGLEYATTLAPRLIIDQRKDRVLAAGLSMSQATQQAQKTMRKQASMQVQELGLGLESVFKQTQRQAQKQAQKMGLGLEFLQATKQLPTVTPTVGLGFPGTTPFGLPKFEFPSWPKKGKVRKRKVKRRKPRFKYTPTLIGQQQYRTAGISIPKAPKFIDVGAVGIRAPVKRKRKTRKKGKRKKTKRKRRPRNIWRSIGL